MDKRQRPEQTIKEMPNRQKDQNRPGGGGGNPKGHGKTPSSTIKSSPRISHKLVDAPMKFSLDLYFVFNAITKRSLNNIKTVCLSKLAPMDAHLELLPRLIGKVGKQAITAARSPETRWKSPPTASAFSDSAV